jgi:hypothetical protein
MTFASTASLSIAMIICALILVGVYLLVTGFFTEPLNVGWLAAVVPSLRGFL